MTGEEEEKKELEIEESKLENLHEMTRNIIFNFVGVHSYKSLKTAEMKISDNQIPVKKDMLKFMKTKFSTLISKRQLSFAHKLLTDALDTYDEGPKTPILMQRTYSTMFFLWSFILNATCCRFKFSEMVENKE